MSTPASHSQIWEITSTRAPTLRRKETRGVSANNQLGNFDNRLTETYGYAKRSSTRTLFQEFNVPRITVQRNILHKLVSFYLKGFINGGQLFSRSKFTAMFKVDPLRVRNGSNGTRNEKNGRAKHSGFSANSRNYFLIGHAGCWLNHRGVLRQKRTRWLMLNNTRIPRPFRMMLLERVNLSLIKLSMSRRTVCIV